jgi:superoxide dismutase
MFELMMVLGLMAVLTMSFADGEGGSSIGETIEHEDGGKDDFPDDDFDVSDPSDEEKKEPSEKDNDGDDANDEKATRKESKDKSAVKKTKAKTEEKKSEKKTEKKQSVDDAGEKSEEEIPEIDDDLKSRAKGYGLSEEEMEEYGAERLKKVLDNLDSRFDRRMAELGRSRQQKPEEKQETTPKEEKKEEGKKDSSGTPEEFKIELDPEIHDPDYIKTFEGMKKHYTDRISNLEQKLNTFLKKADDERAAQAKASIENGFDQAIDSLGADYEPLFGKGRGREMDSKSETFANRIKVFNEMRMLAIGYSQSGEKIPKDLFQRAVRSVFGEQMKESSKTNARKEISNTLNKQKSQMLSRPTDRRKTKSSDPDQDARDFASQFMREHGQDTTEEQEDFEL